MTVGKEKHRVAVVLSGGGGKGAYQVGALKALRSAGVVPDIYCGTSVGSFNCGMLASGKSLEEVEKVWREMNTESVFKLRFDPRRFLTLNPQTALRFAFQSAKMLGGFVTEALKGKGSWWEAIDIDSFLLDTSPLADLIEKHVDLAALRKNDKDFSIALTQLKPVEGYPLRIVKKHEITHRHILASCSLPFIFPQVTIGGRVYCDGGVVMNSPLKPAVDAGADEIYVIDLTPPPPSYREATLPLAYQIMSAQCSSMLQRDIDLAHDLNGHYLAAHAEGKLVDGKAEVKTVDTRPGRSGSIITRHYRYLRIFVIRPSTDLEGIGGFLRFEPASADTWIEAGERETRETLQKHYEEEIAAPDGTKIKAVFRR